MIVSCESCKSRYKLDDSKITGRGAKITCPKCKHVFVVLAPPPAVAESPGPSLLPQGQGEWEDEEPTRVGREAAAAAAAPEPPVPGEHEVVRPRGAAAGTPAAPAAPTKEQIAARAATLDFRKVGVNAWKVKVRIGLVYDFSDIKTLRKYIQDGRVTPADIISHDGKTWKPLGEIPDLDAFFVEAYERLEVEYAGKAPAAKESQPSHADLGNVAAALAAAAAAEVDEDGQSAPGRPQATGPVYEDPFEALKQRQRDRGGSRKATAAQAQAQKQASSDSKLIQIAGAAVLLLVLGGGAWWMFGRTPPAPPPSEKPVVKVEAKSEGKASTIAEDPEKWHPKADEPTTAPPAPLPSDCPAGFEWNQKLQNCVQTGPGPGGRPPPGGASTAGGKPDAGTAPVASGMKVSDSDDETVGDDAMKQRDYNTAVMAYSKALSGGKAAVRIKLGEAQLRAGDQAAAMSTLTQAAASNKKAYKLLGELKEQMGDAAGAKAAYGDYLQAFPKDAAVKAKFDSLGG